MAVGCAVRLGVTNVNRSRSHFVSLRLCVHCMARDYMGNARPSRRATLYSAHGMICNSS